MSTATLTPQPIPAIRQRKTVQAKEQLNIIGMALLVLLLLTVFVDINTLTRLVLGTQRIGSPLILLVCLALYIVYRFRFFRGLGKAGRIYVASFGVYLIVGSVVRLIDFSDVAVYTTWYYLQMNISSLVILLACVPAARNAVLSNNGHRLIMMCFAILMISVFLLFLAKFMGASVYATETLDKKVKLQFESGRVIGFFTNANQAGMAMTLAAAFGFACLATTRRRLLVITCIMLAGVACVTTYSRSSMLTFAGVAIVQILTSSVFRSKSIILASIIAVGGFSWFVIEGYKMMGAATREQQKRIASFTELASGDFSEEHTGHRFAVAAVGLEYWLRSPLFGHGLGNGRTLDLGMGVHSLGPHNQFVLLLVEAGVLGGGMFVLALAAAWYAAIKCKVPEIRALAIAGLTVFSCNCLTSHTVLTQNYYAAMLGIVFGCLSGANALTLSAKSLRLTQAGMAQPSLVG